jgi:hypothetical protein
MYDRLGKDGCRFDYLFDPPEADSMFDVGHSYLTELQMPRGRSDRQPEIDLPAGNRFSLFKHSRQRSSPHI